MRVDGFEQRLPREFSGSQQQRVAVARSLVLEPSVLLFDELPSNLDARLRRSMREEIRALQQRLQLTAAYVTHDQSEALAVSNQIIVMVAGLIAQAGTPRQLYEQPATEFVAGFMGGAVRFEAVVDEAGLVHLGSLRFPPRRPVPPGPVRVAVRPEAWHVAAPALATAPGAGMAPQAAAAGQAESLPGTLRKMAYLGSFLELTVDTPLGEVFVVSPEVDQPWQLGDTLVLRLGRHGVSVASG